MGRFNNYQSDLVYTPQTFEKLALLPMQLRKRQDDLEAQNDLIQLNIANTKVAPGYQEAYDRKRQDFENKSKSLAERMASEGSGNPNLIKEFQNLKRQYNNDAAATGIFGAGAQRYKDDLESEKVYTQYGVEKSGQNPDQVAKKWKEKYNADQEKIRQGLANDPNYIPDQVVHDYAPRAVSVTDFAKQLQGLIGASSYSKSRDILTDLSNATIKGSDGLLSVNTKSDMYKNNKNQVQGFVNLMNSNLLDKASPLNQHLKYNDKDPYEYVNDVQNLATMLYSSDEAHANKINPIGGGSGASASVATPKDNQGGVILQERTQRSPDMEIVLPYFNEGKPVNLNGANVNQIEKHMEQLEQAGVPEIQSQQYATQKQAVIDFKEGVKMFDLANNDLMEEAFKKTKYYSKDGKRGLEGKVNRARSYGEFVQRQKEMEAQTAIQLKQRGVSDSEIRRILSESENYMNQVKQDIREKTGASDLMYSQNVYGFGFNEASAKLVDSSVDFLKSNAQFFKDQAGKNSFAYQVNDDGSEELINTADLNAPTASDIRVSSIATKNGKGVPSIGLELRYKGKDGEPDSVRRLDLEVSDKTGNIAKEVIQKMLKETDDPKTAYVLNSVLDSASANQVIPDSKEYEGSAKGTKGASRSQSDMIVAFNAASTTGRNKNTINPRGSYQVISQGPHYALRVKQPGDVDYHVYNVNDLMYDRTPRGNSTTQRQKQDVKNKEVAALYTLLGYDPDLGVSSFVQGVHPITPEDNGDKRNILSLALNDYAMVFNRAGATQEERDNATNLFIERTKNIGLKSMNKAAFLKN